MTQQTTDDALDAAISALIEHVVADAQRADADGWLYASRMFGIHVPDGDGPADVTVSAWVGRHGQEFRNIGIDDPATNQAMAEALLAADETTRLAVVRISRLPQVDADALEVAVDYVEFAFDSPVDVADLDLGGFSLFGDI